MVDDVSVDELRVAVENILRVPARFVEVVSVKETFHGALVWEGAVRVFDVTGHPSGATRAYAWSDGTKGVSRRLKAVLGVPPVDGPEMAVRVSILASTQTPKN
jgi:hypothetical protein